MTLAALFLALIATPADLPASASADHGEPVLLDFHTEWCSPCRAMRPAIAKLIDAGYPVRSVDGDREKDLVRKYGITAFPTFIVVDEDGRALGRVEGARPAQELATLYREAQAKVRYKPLARQVARRDDLEVPAAADADENPAERRASPNPKPWQTVVRIRMKMGNGYEGVGSGTVIYSDANSALVLTCAHIFKEEGRKTPPPSQCRMPITVDLFDGVLGGPRKNQVHYVETVKGEAVDYDLTNDVGLIRIRPGKVLPAAKVVPPYWHPKEGMHMLTVGCSEGHDATAWDTQILRSKAGLKNTGTGESFHVIECKNPPKQGRSGGGLFTDDFYVAGVCDFADPQHGNGLYAEPASIYRLLDRNRLVALYDPSSRDRREGSREMLADSGKPRSQGVYRGQSPGDGELTMPPPAAFGIKPPAVASSESESRKPVSSHGWQSAGSAKLASRPSPSRREAEAVPAEMNREDVDSPPAPPADEVGNPDDVPARAGRPANWRPVRRAE
jgi:thiol-disulfide isomerase/thioredoxin